MCLNKDLVVHASVKAEFIQYLTVLVLGVLTKTLLTLVSVTSATD